MTISAPPYLDSAPAHRVLLVHTPHGEAVYVFTDSRTASGFAVQIGYDRTTLSEAWLRKHTDWPIRWRARLIADIEVMVAEQAPQEEKLPYWKQQARVAARLTLSDLSLAELERLQCRLTLHGGLLRRNDAGESER